MLMGLAIAMFCLPFIQLKGSFLKGVIACMVAITFASLALFIWNPQAPLFRWAARHTGSEDSGPKGKTSSFPRRFIAVFFLTVGLIFSFLLYRHNELLKTFMAQQKIQVAKQEELIESARKSGLGQLMGHVLDKMDDELKASPTRTLSDKTITRIADLSYSFKPYAYSKGDSITTKLVSPERGQLLLVLSRMNIDSVSLQKIRAQVSFAGADLRNADLQGMNLSGMDLSEADLMDADLQGADLSGSNLSFVNLWGAQLNKANLRGAILKRADLRWAELNEADLKSADLHEADLNSAQLRKADLRGAILKWTDFSGAFLHEANLTGADLYRSVMKRAQFLKANLSGTNMVLANLIEANMSEANLTGAILDEVIVLEKDWLIRLEEWHVTGTKEIQSKYKMVEGSNELTYYQLKNLEKN